MRKELTNLVPTYKMAFITLKSVLGLSIKQKATEFEINHNVPVVEIENKDINVSIDSKEKEKLTLWERVGSTLRLIYSNLIAVL